MTSIDIVSIFLSFLLLSLFWHLSQKIKYVEKMGIDIPVFLKGMNDILDKVTQNIQILQNHARATHKNMNEKLPQIQEKTEDLALLIERTERTMKGLESLIEKGREIEKTLNKEDKSNTINKTLDPYFCEEEEEQDFLPKTSKNHAFSFMKRR
jgi:hypothetical protein